MHGKDALIFINSQLLNVENNLDTPSLYSGGSTVAGSKIS